MTYDLIVIAAHRDDAEVQMGGTLAKLAQAGQRALIVDLCDGEPSDHAHDEALTRVTAALKVEGFGVLTEIDVKETLKKKLDVDFRPYKILGACNPPLAYRALSAGPEAGLLLPCNVTVSFVEEHVTEVSIVDPLSMLGLIRHPDLEPVAAEARARLDRVAAALKV